MSNFEQDGLAIFKHTEIYSRNVRGRTLIYLDQNIWIDLEEGKYSDVLILLRALRQSNRILCPLSSPLVQELFAQPTHEYRQRRSRLMDELSGGIAIRDSTVREHNELKSIYASQSRNDFLKKNAFTFIAECFGNMIIRPANNSLIAAKIAEYCVAYCETSEELRSVVWLVNNLALDELNEHHKQSLQRYVQNIKLDLDSTRSALSGFHKSQQRGKALHKIRCRKLAKYARFLRTQDVNDLRTDQSTRTQVVDDFLLPLHHCRNSEKVAQLVNQPNEPNGSPNRKLLNEFFIEIPTIELQNHYYANLYLGLRLPRPQDFYDVEHMMTVPYVDCFVTADRYLSDTLQKTTIPQLYGCQIINGAGELRKFLGDLLKT